MNTEQDQNLSSQKTTRHIRSERPSRGERPTHGRSADEIKQAVSDTVAKGVAVITGAVEGVANELAKSDLAGTASEVVRTAGRTAREVSTTAKRQVEKTKKALREETGEDDKGSSSLGQGSGPANPSYGAGPGNTF